uniref:Ig-like domain-containing protein n=1 Tax=Periophthalmus magnuspinnatus TaxID=409849 RepID=A0A3B4AUF6_9GOBI
SGNCCCVLVQDTLSTLSSLHKQMLWTKEGDDATLDCSHRKGPTYYQMYWYRQRPGENIRQIVFTTPSTEPDFETDFKNERLKVTKPDAESGTLTVENLEPGDSGVYFCAVSEHSEANPFKT